MRSLPQPVMLLIILLFQYVHAGSVLDEVPKCVFDCANSLFRLTNHTLNPATFCPDTSFHRNIRECEQRNCSPADFQSGDLVAKVCGASTTASSATPGISPAPFGCGNSTIPSTGGLTSGGGSTPTPSNSPISFGTTTRPGPTPSETAPATGDAATMHGTWFDVLAAAGILFAL